MSGRLGFLGRAGNPITLLDTLLLPPSGLLRPLDCAILAALLVALAGCGDPDGSASDAGTLDISVREARVLLEIGSLDGPTEEVFGRVGGLAEDDAGRIYVADLQSDEVRAFDGADGTYLFRVARQGEGPGEVGTPCCLTFGPNGELWVRDIDNARYQAFEIGDVGVVDSRALRMASRSPGYFAPISFVGDSLVDVGMGSDPELYRFVVPADGGEPRAQLVPEPGASELGAEVIDTEVNGNRARFFFWPPHGPRYLSAHGPDGFWADARSSSFRVWLRTPSGDSLLIERPGLEGPPLSTDEREAAAARISRDRARAGAEASRIDWSVPERKQVLAQLLFDQSGRLWVQRSVREGADQQADVFSRDGQYLETRTWPWAVQLGVSAWAGEQTALGIATDSLGVQKVVKLEWPR